MMHALCSGRLTLALLTLGVITTLSLQVRAQTPASSDTQGGSFPRCALEKEERQRFLSTYARGHLALARFELDAAQQAFEQALELCMEDEVLWFLSRTHLARGEEQIAHNLEESWRAQRRLRGLSLDPPGDPSWRSATAPRVAALPLPLDTDPWSPPSLPLHFDARSAPHSGTTPLPLPIPTRRPAAPSLLTTRLSVTLSPPRHGLTLWLSDGTYLGEMPLLETSIPAEQDVTLVIKDEHGAVLQTRTIRGESASHLRLFLTVR